MPRKTRTALESNRARQRRFREKRKQADMVEVRVLLQRKTVAEIELAALFLPAGTKEAVARAAFESHLAQTLGDTRKVGELISRYWGPVLDYRAYAPTLSRAGQHPIRIKERVFTADEAVKLIEIANHVLGFLKARGVKRPDEAAFAIYQRMRKHK
jgi:hypothetical protein